MMNGRAIRLLVGLTLTLTTAFQIEHGNGNPLFPAATTVHTPFLRKTQVLQTPTAHNRFLGSKPSPRSVCGMLDGNGNGNGNGGGEKGVEEIEEEARLKVLENRRRTIREMLKSSESLRNFRINNGLVPELDPETGKPLRSDSKLALTLTAFIVAFGAVTLRIGGRAALVSAVGLDFTNENPELKDNLETVLSYADSLPPSTELFFFVLAWTAVKVLCFDFGGVVLALSAGILFGGVIQGAVCSAAAATIGSSVAFFLAKADTPVRKKALEVVDEYPSLRGIERVVAEDGLKAILTLRLAPLLPIPIGMYNYVYGVTNVPYFDFAAGVFLGSLKPYLLDSYLGVFGKQVVEGTAGDPGGIQDVVLLVVLGVSVLIGVFASQLAGETWESVTAEIEAEKAELNKKDGKEADDGITRQLLGIDLPLWLVGMQLSLQAASEVVEEMVQVEYNAAVWNYTLPEEQPPPELDPKNFPDSPELTKIGSGFDVGKAICEGLVLSPCLFQNYLTYADPLYDPDAIQTTAAKKQTSVETTTPTTEIDNGNAIIAEMTQPSLPETSYENLESAIPSNAGRLSTTEDEVTALLNILSILRQTTKTKLRQVNEEIESL